MSKLKILFDVTMLLHGMLDERSRSGIFFVAQNILREMRKNATVEIILLPQVTDSVELFLKRDDCFYSLDLFQKPTSLDFLFFRIRSFIKKIRLHFANISLIRKALYVLLKEINVIHSFVHHYDFSQCQPDQYVYFSPNQPSPKNLTKKGVECFVVIYDLIPFLLKDYKDLSQAGWFRSLTRSINSHDTYFAISAATKKDFLAYFSCLKSEQVQVVPLAASEHFKREQDEFLLKKIKDKYNIPNEKKYIFSLCTLEPRKNLFRTVACFVEFVKKHGIDDIVFVLGGGAGTALAQQIKETIASVGDGLVLPVGYVDDDDLPILYSNAEWFVYTSQYEGFGLPPLEAMQCGCPVITSNNSSLPEVVGDAGIMIDWDSDEQHIEAYEKYYFNEELRKENSRKGLERAKLFSWKKTVEKMVETMKKSYNGDSK